ncbi:FecCD family ABC transporter permease [Comamonas testosteroni]|uniref:FecCD family ABC transporter permease n=1 Tax=Comamonas testosteroni TaxID=285 RepID=UPI00389A68C1
METQAIRKSTLVYSALVIMLVTAATLSVANGAVQISAWQAFGILLRSVGVDIDFGFSDQQAAVLTAIRVPRVLLGILVGSALAASGVALQGLFRNPMADPGLLGISSGASFFVGLAVILHFDALGLYSLPAAAFLGSGAATLLIYGLAQQDRKTNVTVMLLAGIAMSAFFTAGTGLFTYLSSDEQLRTITFWQLGSLAAATWPLVQSATPFLLICLIGLPFLANALNALLLGERNARYLGIRVERVKWLMILLIAVGVGAAVSVSGLIGFVGLTVPHIVRFVWGPNHRHVLPGSMLVGAILLVSADLVARTIVIPQELPIGLMTALLGAPFFLYLVLKSKRRSA